MVLSLAKLSVYSVWELNYMMSGVCESFRFEDRRVCSGMADLFAEQLYYILRHTKLAKQEMCAQLIGAQCLPDICVYDKKNKWTVSFDNKFILNTTTTVHNTNNNIVNNTISDYNNIVVDSSTSDDGSTDDNKTYKILHLSDLHIDPFYSYNSSSACGEPLCCRTTSAQGKGSAGYWGDYNNCDSPKYTIEMLMTYLNKTMANDFQYIIWTGDIVAHDVWNTTRDIIINGSRSLTQLINQHIANGKLVFPVVGNHEGLPVNQFAPPEIEGKLSIKWLYNELLNQWSQWIPWDYHQTFATYGCYAKNVSDYLRIIVLNTNYCSRLNFWLMYDLDDPGAQLKWLAAELFKASQLGQRVHIIGHIPPDNTQCTSHWVYNYLRIVHKYNQTIVGQFFGHTHFDEFRLQYSPENKSQPIGVAYLTPSVTTYMGVNPAFRFYTIDTQGNVLDHQNYYLNLTDANHHIQPSQQQQLQQQWINEYSAKKSYNMTTLSPENWNLLYEKLLVKSGDNRLFDRYYNHYHRYSDWFAKNSSIDFRQQLLNAIPIVSPITCN
ncbi:sphingomyelin phosphodiesterase-like [Oppia nitens]|uniref:sphingomyelin phosphodiesterase-like n=1 Tax=Oppia nitens TaxID=1686743 RepID=UPI0023DB3A17|nr:sphingomyelin phosphodiesterase-like [Oppia nitens]